VTPALRRVWLVLAAALLVSALLQLPYSHALMAQGPLRDQEAPRLRAVLGLLAVAVAQVPLAALGLVLARRLGLGAPLLEAWAERRPVPWRRTLAPAAFWGVLAGGSLLGLFALVGERIDALFPVAVVPPPWWAGVLASFSAGIQEETSMRLFVLSALAVALARVLPRPAALWTANALAALAFGALHFGNVVALGLPFTAVLVTFILVVNGGLGLLCGWLYTTTGLEAAIVCHAACDLVLHGLGGALGGTGGA
jgi:hypothetical protein